MTRQDRESNKAAWARYRAGKGPKPKPRAPHESEVERRAKLAKLEELEVAQDPILRTRDRKSTARLKGEHAELVELLEVERERNAFITAVGRAPSNPKVLRTEKRSGIREMMAVVQGSDWHVEEPVDPAKVSYRNEYNLEIADQRVHRFFQGAIDLVEHHRSSGKVVIRDMTCAFSGDLMSGYIHPELAEENDLSPVETALWLKPRLKNGIHTLLEKLQLRSLSIPWSYGNHGRTTVKTRIGTGAENSYEWLLGRMLEQDFAGDKRVTFDTNPSPFQFVQAYDYTLGFHHGDSVRYMGGVGGLSIPVLKALSGWNSVRKADLWHLGHFHQYTDLGQVMVNGSLIGYGPFSRWIRAVFEEPKQIFYLLDSKRGKCHATPIWVSESQRAK